MGTLPVVSNVSSLPEVVPVRELQFDPTSVEDMGETLLAAWQQPPRQKQAWLKELQQHAQQFNWDDSARVVCEKLVEMGEKA